MADTSASVTFKFVNSTLTSPTAAQDLEVRAMIRKQAMKKASAARRRDGNYGKHNLRQYPIFLIDTPPDGIEADRRKELAATIRSNQEIKQEEKKPSGATGRHDIRSNNSSVCKPGRDRWLARLAIAQSLPQSLSASGYESISMKTGFDILDLSTLATFHIGRAVRAALSQNLYHLIHQLRSHKQWSYLSFLPSRYGQSTCLSDAVDCVIARARQIISPGENWEAAVITFYVKALDSLQKALDCPRQRFLPEVLAATEVLALYELLDPCGETAWVRHTAGAAKLVQLRGYRNYNTEFEKALFMCQTVPIMTESLLNGNRCFLEQPDWQKVLRSVIEPGAVISDRSDIVITLLTIKSHIPGLFHEVTAHIFATPPPSSDTICELVSRIRNLRSKLDDWHERYRIIIKKMGMGPENADFDNHCKVFANYLSCNMVTNRLLGAMRVEDRKEAEGIVIGDVGHMLVLEREVEAASEQTIMFMAHTMGVAKSCVETAPDWQVKDGEKSSTTGMIEKWKFEDWCRKIGRKLPTC